MTPENAKVLLPIITAYAEGKTIQLLSDEGEWFRCDEPSFNSDPSKYRIKPEPKLVPMTSDDLPPFFWITRTKRLPGPVSSYLVATVCSDNGLVTAAGFTVQTEEMHEWDWSTDRKIWYSLMKEVTE